MHNAGESSAHDVVVVAPVSEHAAYVAGSARVNGREIERDLGVGNFDRLLYAPIVATSLQASASATLVYRIRIDKAPLPDGTQIYCPRGGRVAGNAGIRARAGGAGRTRPAGRTFGDDRTTFAIDLSHDVRPGQRVVLTLVAYNAGTPPPPIPRPRRSSCPDFRSRSCGAPPRSISGVRSGIAARMRWSSISAKSMRANRVELRTEAVVDLAACRRNDRPQPRQRSPGNPRLTLPRDAVERTVVVSLGTA